MALPILAVAAAACDGSEPWGRAEPRVASPTTAPSPDRAERVGDITPPPGRHISDYLGGPNGVGVTARDENDISGAFAHEILYYKYDALTSPVTLATESGSRPQQLNVRAVLETDALIETSGDAGWWILELVGLDGRDRRLVARSDELSKEPPPLAPPVGRGDLMAWTMRRRDGQVCLFMADVDQPRAHRELTCQDDVDGRLIQFPHIGDEHITFTAEDSQSLDPGRTEFRPGTGWEVRLDGTGLREIVPRPGTREVVKIGSTVGSDWLFPGPVPPSPQEQNGIYIDTPARSQRMEPTVAYGLSACDKWITWTGETGSNAVARAYHVETATIIDVIAASDGKGPSFTSCSGRHLAVSDRRTNRVEVYRLP